MYSAIVTGASSGIGKAIYEALKEGGDFTVIGASRHGPDWSLDLRKPIPYHIFPPFDLLVNCAGIMPFDETREVLDVNFWGTFNMINNLAFKEGACIINIASVSVSDPEFPIYSASKAAVISLTKSLAKKFAPHVRVNCISPGFYKTNLVPGLIPDKLIETIPMGYAEDPKKIVSVVHMLWNTKYITGANIIIDGGVSL